MKKIFGIILFMIAFAMGADVKPFTFDNIAQDSASQQNQFDYMLKYKLFGHDFIKIGNDVVIPDESGWNGTAGDITSNARLTLGGPILVNGTFTMGDGQNMISGPVRTKNLNMGNVNNSQIASPVCLSGTANSNALSAIEGHTTYNFDAQICKDSVPAAPVNLEIPSIDWDNLNEDIKLDDIIQTNNGVEYTIDVPPGDKPYKVLVDKIHMCKGGFNQCKIYVKMPDGGRLTEIFVKDFQYGRQSTIQVVYKTDTADVVLTQGQYRGNLLIYTNSVLSFDNTDNYPIMGTFISTDSIFLGRNINIAGQLISTKLEIGNTLDGKSFRFVKFDPDTIDVKLDKYGGLRENDSTVVIPIELSDTSDIKVSFKYCFDLKDGVTLDDFNIPPSFPICGKDEPIKVIIPIGSKVPSDPIKVNVKVDTLTELNDYLVIKIDSISGAILPDGKTDGELKIKIIDAPHSHVEFDTTAVYKFEENKKGIVDNIKVLNATANTRFYLDSAYTDRYKLDSLTGELTLIGDELDYEKAKVDVIKVTLKDTGDVEVTRNIPISVIDINEAPSLNDTTIILSENLPIPSIVGTLKASDEDIKIAFTDNRFEILSGDSNFGIDAKTGRITATKIFNYETDDQTYELKVRVYDYTDPTLCDTATVTIKIGNINDGPKFPTHDTTFFINENVKPGIIGTVTAVDEDKDKLTYSVVGNVPFTVDSVGNIKNTREFDYEKETGFTFKVVVSDGKATDTCKVIVKVVDVNEPCSVNDTTFSIKEHTTGKVGNVNAKDEDKDSKFATLTYTIDDDVNYQVDKDGNIFVKTPLNYEEVKADTVKVYITDGTYKDSATVIIKVVDIPEDIVITGTVNPVEENTELGTPVGVVNGKDGDSTAVTYTINTTDFKIDPVTGVITTNSMIDYETQSEYPVVVTAKSTDGSKKDTAFVIKVIDVDEPVHAHDTTFTVPENTTGEIGKVTGEDEDGKPVKFSCDDTVHYSIDTNTGVVRLVDPFDYEVTQKDTLTVYVTDVNGNKDTATVIINVKNVNEDPVLQKNDSLTVPENCKNCIVGIITATDPDKDPITYVVKEPGFTIDSNGVLKLTEPLDYEKTKEVPVTVIAKDPFGSADTATYVIKVTDINEPVHVKDTTCSVKENYTGKVCKIDAWDEDKTTPKYTITDTTNYSIDSTGTITIKTPIDYEKKTKDTVTVIVTDGEFSDTAQVIIRVLDEPEDVKITEWDHNPPPDTVKTNNPDHEYKWTICEGDSCITHYDNPRIHKDTTIKVCNDKKTVCDSIVVLFNDAPPVVTLTNAKSTDALIDYITIEEQKDDKIYVNKKDNELKVTVRDTVHKTEKTFPIDVKLDTVHVSTKNVVEYNYLIDESIAKVTPIGNGLYEVKEVVKVDGRNVTMTKIVNKDMKPVDTVQTVTYTVKQDGKELTITYKTDNLTGQRIGDYQVSYKIDSCTTVSYYLGDNKKITKNEEGNIAYTVSYEYTDDFGNKASSKVDIIFDDIPPKVEILEPIKSAVFNTNAIKVKWTVNGEVQDTLNLQRLEKGPNLVIRRYVDKAGNVTADTVMVIMKEAKDIDITLVHPVTMVDQDKVDEYYSDSHHKYNDKKPYDVKFVDPKNDTLPDVIGVGFKVDIVLPSVSPTGSLATLNDIVKNGQIPVDDKGNIVGASTKGIPVDQYVEEHCTEEFQKDYKKNGLNIPLYDVTYNLHLWVYTNAANYVNDFNIEFTLNDEAKTTSAGTVQMVIDWLADKDGHVKAKNKHALGTGAYLTKLFSKSVAKHRCDYKEQVKGDKTVKKDETFKTFGFKRPKK